MTRNPLLDIDFLKELDLSRQKELYAKISLLSFDEQPIKEIQGVITQGSINVDGNSAVRRTCSLTMVTNDKDINKTHWVLKNKFKLEVGVKNIINSNYPDIIWFKQGIYVFTSINMSVQAQNYTINLSGKDKMCLLNGEFGGTITAETDFGTMEYTQYEEDHETIKVIDLIHLPIRDIIKNSVQVYGGEPPHNIIINDIEDYGVELLEYRGEKPIYFLRSSLGDNGAVENLIINQAQRYWYESISQILDYYNTTNPNSEVKDSNGKRYWSIQVSQINDKYLYNPSDINPDSSSENIDRPEPLEVFRLDKDGEIDTDQSYNIMQITKLDTTGYRLTDLTYPGDLIAKVGESLVSVLDKIKKVFTDFEYFYDLDGRFIFQKKMTYINQAWNPLQNNENETYVDAAAYSSAVAYSFEHGNLLTAFTNTPAINNIKNDFSVWGTRKSSVKEDIPIHLRYAIDTKPIYYKPVRYLTTADGTIIRDQADEPVLLENILLENLPIYKTSDYLAVGSEEYEIPKESLDESRVQIVDWREIIYQMALDYYTYNHQLEDFGMRITTLNPYRYKSFKTNYERYYIDLQAFWRQLYWPMDLEEKILNAEKSYWSNHWIEDIDNAIWVKNGRVEDGKTAKALYAKDKIDQIDYKLEKIKKEKQENNYYIESNWNKLIDTHPENLNFWFDFLDTSGYQYGNIINAELEQYSINIIGDRTKTVNDNKINAISFKETPKSLFLTAEDYEKLGQNSSNYQNMTGYTFIRLDKNLEQLFTISAQGRSAWDELNSLLNQHTCATESVTLTAIPIYHLQPNIRVYIKDEDTKINGEYIINKISIPLQYNGTSSITATKVIDRIY